MTITRTNSFVPGTFLKACSLCGIRYRANELRRGEDGFWRCLAYCVEVPPITRDKIATMSSKRKEAPPPPHGTPFDRANTYAAEATIFNFLCEQRVRDPNWPTGFRLGVAPSPYVDVTNGSMGALAPNPQTVQASPTSFGSVMCAGETCRYLYNIINDNLRPLRWISVAKTKMRELADWLITLQRGFGTSPASTKTNDGLWGGIIDQPAGNLYYADQNASAGLAMLYAFRSLGDAKYLASAKASASFMRNMQAAPNGAYIGAVVQYVQTIATPGSSYYPSTLLALELWNELLTTAGDGQYGSDGTPAGFSSIPQQLLSLCISDLRTFWRNGYRDSTTGAVINGLSSATLCEYLSHSASFDIWNRVDGQPSLGGAQVTSQNIALALRSLYAYEGYSTQVADVWTYLMALGSDPQFKSAAGTLATDYSCAIGTNSANPSAPPVGQGNVIAPSFDPTLALSTFINVPSSTNGLDYYWRAVTTPAQTRCTYDWTTFGLLAAIQSAKNQGAFRKAKDAAVTTRYRMPVTFVDLPVEETVLLRGSSGLAFQLSQFDDVDPATGTPSTRLVSTTAAAMIGNAFRYAPQGYTGAGGPGNPYSQKKPGVQV